MHAWQSVGSTKGGSSGWWGWHNPIILKEDPNCIRKVDIPKLRLSEGQKTNARLYSPAPQLERVGRSASPDAPELSVIECLNTGSYNGYKPIWDCSFKDYKESNLYKLDGYYSNVKCEPCYIVLTKAIPMKRGCSEIHARYGTFNKHACILCLKTYCYNLYSCCM